ncbi:MAG: short-chain dehydrogenase [Candidatus Marinimicrobia bacterium]|nr:short-chain dehydrogenase [Candidatus Neomarinimicrobiota bacterium]MBL7010269.1 short-chain dehydrogenase [Candidatus Neomarinimicrobiota bacterium]MBL7030209.1 short-chain dehydrogenase [Candidatus Neomarinimicrobiota bacterium]
MDIKKRRVLILGGWGLVGTAILRKLAVYKPKEVIILSLKKSEALEACQLMKNEFPNISYTPEWGNIFVRESQKDLSRTELLENPDQRKQLMQDTMESFNTDKLDASFLNQVIARNKPHIIIDTVNTATALAYQDLYNGYYNLKKEMESESGSKDKLFSEVEKMLTTLYTPQIIRHIQILHSSMVENGTGVYIKIGTTGTGGMGLNIPYTHSEEKPSRVLLSKSSLAGAHTMLLFLMGRTPDGPIVKEIKPAAAIAWKGIQYGEISKHGQPIHLYDCKIDHALELSTSFNYSSNKTWEPLNDTLKSVFIDTGENGIFSQGEFETITSAGQMEFVTPEEIASNVILEILGDSTGHDILNALDNSIMGPTYRAGYMRHHALDEMKRLQKEHNVESIAFEMLGPPRLSKILHEANILKKVCGDLRCVLTRGPKILSEQAENMIQNNLELRSQIISIGIPILLADGKRLLRGPEVKIPTQLGRNSISMDDDNINDWSYAGWVDLRENNMKIWQNRIEKILSYIDSIKKEDTSSLHHHGVQYWNVDHPMNIGKVAAWIFINEDKGLRVKR